MNYLPHNWNVVVLGSWNKSILTPNFIAKNIYKTTDGSPFQVEIPVDLLLPPRIKFNDNICIVDNDKILIETSVSTIDNLITTLNYAKNAIDALPITPVLAAGFNIRFTIEDYQSTLINLLFGSEIDSILARSNYEVLNRNINRTVKLKDGMIGIYINYINNQTLEFQLNFEKESTNVADLKNWLSITPDELNLEIEKCKTIFEESSYE